MFGCGTVVGKYDEFADIQAYRVALDEFPVAETIGYDADKGIAGFDAEIRHISQIIEPLHCAHDTAGLFADPDVFRPDRKLHISLIFHLRIWQVGIPFRQVDPAVPGCPLEKLDLSSVFDYLLSTQGQSRGERDSLAPERIAVPSGSHVRIDYTGAEPVAEAKLQECFGMMETPKVAGGSVPVVMTLLSPAMRPCAVTKDLAGFWREGYQLVKKDLKGRYPKHYWPDDPFTAVATRKVRPK